VPASAVHLLQFGIITERHGKQGMDKKTVRRMVSIISLILNLLLVANGLIFVKNMLPFALALITMLIWVLDLYEIERKGLARWSFFFFLLLLMVYIIGLTTFELQPYNQQTMFEGFVLRNDTMKAIAGSIQIEYWICAVGTFLVMLISFFLSLAGILQGPVEKKGQPLRIIEEDVGQG